jgi:fucose permease
VNISDKKACCDGLADNILGNARLAGLEKDLKLTGYDYNAVLSVFYVSYIVFEIPSNILCKKIGPGWFIPATSLAFGICSLGTAFVNTYSQVCGVRFLLGRVSFTPNHQAASR